MRETKVFERKGKTEMKNKSLMIPFCTSLIYKADTKFIGLVSDSIQAWMFESMQVSKYATMQYWLKENNDDQIVNQFLIHINYA